MGLRDRRVSKRIAIHPTCVFCDTTTRPAVVYRCDTDAVRGWRCPTCGFKFIHPREIAKALQLLE